MLSIYFEDKVINFAPDAPVDAHMLPPPQDVAKVLQKLEIIKSAWVVSPRYEELFADFCRLFQIRKAAGGVVVDPRGRVLMILRNGRWDLPKGHIENGESVEQCAVREVKEECGIDAVAGEWLCTTCHAYLLDGRWALKHCEWLSMRSPGEGTISPQIEEGIERVEWIGREELEEKLRGSYPTIRNVIKTWIDNEK